MGRSPGFQILRGLLHVHVLNGDAQGFTPLILGRLLCLLEEGAGFASLRDAWCPIVEKVAQVLLSHILTVEIEAQER